jgi:hypothetical protein
MRIFDHPNSEFGFICPICGLSDDKPIVLIPKTWTEENGIAQADQVHLSCIDLRMSELGGYYAILQLFRPIYQVKETTHD